MITDGDTHCETVVYIIYSFVYRDCAKDYVNIIIISIDDNYNIIIVFNKPTSRRSSIYYIFYYIHLETRITPRTHVIIDYNIRVIRSVAAGKH